MIYTIGYQKNSLAKIVKIMTAKDIDLLVDIRSVPYSRSPEKYEFNKNRLIARLNERYSWLGNMCGGKSGLVKESCIKKLIFLSSPPEQRKILLMCMENHPCDCHRLYDVSRRLGRKGVQVSHLFDGEEKTTDELSEDFCKKRSEATRG